MLILENQKKIINQKVIQSKYMEEVVLTQLEEVIDYTTKKYSILLDIYGKQFYQNIINSLDAQKLVFINYKEELEVMHEEFKQRVEFSEYTHLDESFLEYEEELVHAITIVSSLISKFDIQINFYKKSIEEEKYDEKKKLDY